MWCDDREPVGRRGPLLEWLRQRDVPAEVRRLSVADFAWYDSNDDLVLVTRKSSDLLQSAFSGHLDDELRAMRNELAVMGGRSYTILEGRWTTGGGTAQHSSGQIHQCPQRRLMEIYISLPPIIPTEDLVGTASALAALYRASQQDWPQRQARKGGDNLSRLLNLWPGLPYNVGRSLLAEYGSIRAILLSPDLKRHRGVGPKLIQNLQEVLDGVELS